VCLVILRLLEDFFIHFIPVYRRVAMLGQQVLQQLDAGVGQFYFLDLGQIVVIKDVYLSGAVFAQLEYLLNALSASPTIPRTRAFICAISGALPLVSLKTIERAAR